MTEIELSEFKMFEDAPYELPDVNSLLKVILGGLKEEEKIYGPVFTTQFIEYDLKFRSRKTGAEPKEDIKDLDQLVEYFLSTLDKYPDPWNAMIYAQIKTESEFQGQIGAATKVLEIGSSKVLLEKSSVETQKIDVDEMMAKLREATLAMKISPKELGYKKISEESFDILAPNCDYKEACRAAQEEGLMKRPDGRMRCGLTAFACHFFKVLTGYEWDYDRLEALKPYCVARCYPI